MKPSAEQSELLKQMIVRDGYIISPKVGQAIFFFSHMIHRAQNNSDKTRISIDVRVKNMFAPTNTKPGCYQPLTRGCVAQYAEKMQKNEQEVLCGN